MLPFSRFPSFRLSRFFTLPLMAPGALPRAATVAVAGCRVFVLTILTVGGAAAGAVRTDIPGPARSGYFGATVTALPNGNFVVTDPGYDAPGRVTDAGAVYLYDGRTLALISTLTGSMTEDRVGSEGIVILPNGHFLVRSPYWGGGSGAVTWCRADTGVNGTISAANSLLEAGVNRHPEEAVRLLPNGHYLLCSPGWAGGRGAVTWCDGNTGLVGAVSEVNSLVGARAGDAVGGSSTNSGGGITLLTNGNYVVSSPDWTKGSAARAGAVTWANGNTGGRGVVSAANSLTGTRAQDALGMGFGAVTPLSDGHYVVAGWMALGGIGSVTWCNGTTGRTGTPSAANSLTGSAGGSSVGGRDSEGIGGVFALTNGNYVVCNPRWKNGTAANAGSVTWCAGADGVKGPVTTANSLTGTSANDQVGHSLVALSNGGFVTASKFWNGSRGAATWGGAAGGVTGVVSAENSLVGSKAGDEVSEGGIYSLGNGHYVVRSPLCSNGAVIGAGAVTWGSGTEGVKGTVSAANSLIGGRKQDYVGGRFGGLTVLRNGNYVVRSMEWHSGEISDAGAVTWANGTTGVRGLVSASNSLIGTRSSDHVGDGGIHELSDGNFVICSGDWSTASLQRAGAVTWADGAVGVKGTISAANSLIGGGALCRVGGGGVTVLDNGNYVVRSPEWNNGSVSGSESTGAATWCAGGRAVTGVVSATNSLIGGQAGDRVGEDIIVLRNGNYVVCSPDWNGRRGAVTWCMGTGRTTGRVSPANSLTGDMEGRRLGYTLMGDKEVVALSDGNYAVHSNKRSAGTPSHNGLAALGDGKKGTSGEVSAANSVLGPDTLADGVMKYTYSAPRDRLITGDPRVNLVSVLSLGGGILEDWRAAWFGGATAGTGDLEDFDHDGVPNLVEFAFGTRPDSASAGPSPLQYSGPPSGGGTLTATGQPALLKGEDGGWQALFVRRRDHAAAGLEYIPQFSPDLKTWQPAAAQAPRVLAEDADCQLLSVPYPKSDGAGAERFFRVQIRLTAP